MNEHHLSGRSLLADLSPTRLGALLAADLATLDQSALQEWALGAQRALRAIRTAALLTAIHQVQIEPIELSPCPFCGGPPVPFVRDAERGVAVEEKANYGDEGVYVEACVYCHECGCHGPYFDSIIFTYEDYIAVELNGVRLWQQRDQRDIRLYEGGEAKGLNLYPRPDYLEARNKLLGEVEAIRSAFIESLPDPFADDQGEG